MRYYLDLTKTTCLGTYHSHIQSGIASREIVKDLIWIIVSYNHGYCLPALGLEEH